jgi:hypothetical protein
MACLDEAGARVMTSAASRSSLRIAPAMGYGSKFISERLDLLTQENGDRLNFSQMSKPTTMSP